MKNKDTIRNIVDSITLKSITFIISAATIYLACIDKLIEIDMITVKVAIFLTVVMLVLKVLGFILEQENRKLSVQIDTETEKLREKTKKLDGILNRMDEQG